MQYDDSINHLRAEYAPVHTLAIESVNLLVGTNIAGRCRATWL